MTSKMWQVMNDLEMVTSKICSAREIIDAAIDRIQEHQYDKAETMMSAAYEFLEYYLGEFDEKFKLAWQETVVKQKQEENDAWDAVNKEREYYEGNTHLTCDKDNPSSECKKSWVDFWEETYYPEEYKGSTVSSVQYTEEEMNAMCDKAASDEEKEKCREYNLREAEYYDKRAKLDAEYTKAKIEANSPYNDGWTQEYYQKIVNQIEEEGGYEWTPESPKEKKMTYDEAIAAGWTMTADGFWIKENKKKWVLPVEEVKDTDTDKTEYFVSFPQDLLEAADLKEGDEVHWVDNNDGTYTIRKVTRPLQMDEC